MLLAFTFTVFLAAANLGEKDIAFSICIVFCIMLFIVAWWYTIMRELIWITQAFHHILVTMKRSRVFCREGSGANPVLLTYCNNVFSIRVVLTKLTLCLDWCTPDQFAEFIDYAEERNLTSPPGYVIYGKTVTGIL
jgi:hypothetical protein